MNNQQHTSPFVVNHEGRTLALSRIDFGLSSKGHQYNEAWLQNLLHNNPQSLPTEEIDTAYKNLVPVCTELSTPAGPIDNLFVTPEGKLVVLEAKLWRNPEARRKVIGQILDYAKELSLWDYEELQKQVSKRIATGHKQNNNAVYELVRKEYPDTNEADFVDEVSRSLRTGRFMLLIAGDGIREGATSIAQFLTDMGNLQFTFGLIEVGLYQMPDKNILVQPRVLAKTVIIDRTVVELTSKGMQVQAINNSDSPTKTDGFYYEFWKEFFEGFELDDSSQPRPKIPTAQSLFLSLPPGGNSAWINAYFAGSTNEIGVYFRLAKGEFGEMAYESLSEDENLLTELPESCQWELSKGFHTVAISMYIDDVQAENNREIIKDFFAQNTNLFVNAFRTRMANIAQLIKN